MRGDSGSTQDLVLTFVQYLLSTYYVPETQVYVGNTRPGPKMLPVSRKQTSYNQTGVGQEAGGALT